MKQSRL